MITFREGVGLIEHATTKQPFPPAKQTNSQFRNRCLEIGNTAIMSLPEHTANTINIYVSPHCKPVLQMLMFHRRLDYPAMTY